MQDVGAPLPVIQQQELEACGEWSAKERDQEKTGRCPLEQEQAIERELANRRRMEQCKRQ